MLGGAAKDVGTCAYVAFLEKNDKYIWFCK